MPHIKNPLTVVAIFAALAEVSGTVVLPILERDVQFVYLWFLMLFPVLLISLFFATLNWNHTVLYAPSDFQNEDNFMFAKASASAILRKGDLEVQEQSVQLDDLETETPEAAIEDAGVPAELDAKQQDSTAQTPLAKELPKHIERPSSDVMRLRSRVATDLALGRLEREHGTFFLRDMAVPQRPDLVFDGISAKPGPLTVVEVKYNHSGRSPSMFIANTFSRVQQLYDTLSPTEKSSFKFVMVYVTGDQITEMARTKLIEVTQVISLQHRFETEIHVQKWSDLLP